MSRIILYTIIISIIVLLGSCKKEKPATGVYIGTFKYDYPDNWPDETIWYKISDSNNDYFLIGPCDYNGNLFSYTFQDTIYKDKKNVNGRMPSNVNYGYFIKGKWSRKLFSNTYIIEGDFIESVLTQGGTNSYECSGTFEIKQNKNY